MARRMARDTRKSPAAGQQIIKYFTQHAEHQGKEEFQPATDGYTLYRAIARQVIGFPARFLDIRDAVLQFFLRVAANASHPLHEQLAQEDAGLREEHAQSSLFALLDAPDLSPNDHVLWVIAHALKVRIVVYSSVAKDGQPQELLQSIGPEDRPYVTLLRQEPKESVLNRSDLRRKSYSFVSLMPDESGKALIEYILVRKSEAESTSDRLQIKQMSWSWDAADCSTVANFNEYKPRARRTHLKPHNVRNRMDCFVVTVNKAEDILPALDLLHEALRRAPSQRRWVPGQDAFMRPHCSVDAEFVKLPRDRAADSLDPDHEVYLGRLQELCSVLTFAVSRHLFFMFNIVHMLETADKNTVPALATLFRNTIFNADLLKLWWNPQSDISVLDRTIAQMYQTTPIESYTHIPYRNRVPITHRPDFLIKSQHFGGQRPHDLVFPTEDIEDCELHLPGVNEQGVACCCRLRNIDIAAILNYDSCGHGTGTSDCGKKAWTEHRHGFNYGSLLHTMLSQDRLYPILCWMKNRPNHAAEGKDKFYQDMGKPGMELEHEVMGYNLGDVAGQNMIFEQLCSTDDPSYTAYCLARYGRVWPYGLDPPAPTISDRVSQFGSVGDIQLWEHHPRSFVERPSKGEFLGLCDAEPELYSTESLAPWEHETKVRSMRKQPALVIGEGDSHWSGLYVLPHRMYSDAKESQTKVLTEIQDPTRLRVSGDCVRKVDSVYPDTIVRAGTSHGEAVLELVRSSQCSATHPPVGFGATATDPGGLPPWYWGRVPGKGLHQARNIFEAFTEHDPALARNLGEADETPHETTGWIMRDDVTHEEIFDDAWQNLPVHRYLRGASVWTKSKVAMEDAQSRLERAELKDRDEGPPYSFHAQDMFDPEGREYLRRAKQTAAWNRPPLEPKTTVVDGKVQSLAGLQVRLLKRVADDDEGWEEVPRSSKRQRGQQGDDWGSEWGDHCWSDLPVVAEK